MFPVLSVHEAQNSILRRPAPDEVQVPQTILDRIAGVFGEQLTPPQAVKVILDSIRQSGDAAVARWMEKLDGVSAVSYRVPPNTLAEALSGLDKETRRAMQFMAMRIKAFHQKQPANSWITQEMGGSLGQLIRPIQRVGVYVPAGSAPLPSSVLMSSIPAQVAGVSEIVLVAPPQRDTGQIAPIILAAAALLNLTEVYRLGGAQAIGALAYGTQTIRPVDKIFGPGNLFVTLAKQQVFGVVGIDGLAGPTETVVIADEHARPAWVAADLMAQAEHDVLATAILLTPSRPLAEAVSGEIAGQIETLQRAGIIAASLTQRGGAVITRDLDEAIALANRYAPEHLCLAVENPWDLVPKVQAAGGVFVGEHSFEVLGDYIAGPSHVMPTNGSARFASPLNVWDFVHIISLVALDAPTARELCATAAHIAAAEGLDAHARSAAIRLEAE